MATGSIHIVYTEKDRLELKMNELRNKMIWAARTGLNSHRTIYHSKELDKLIMIDQKLF